MNTPEQFALAALVAAGHVSQTTVDKALALYPGAALTQGAGAVEPVATTLRETVGTLLVYACGSCGHPRSMVGGSHGGYWMQCESCLTKFNLNSTEYGVLMHRAERATDAAAIRAKGTHD